MNGDLELALELAGTCPSCAGFGFVVTSTVERLSSGVARERFTASACPAGCDVGAVRGHAVGEPGTPGIYSSQPPASDLQ